MWSFWLRSLLVAGGLTLLSLLFWASEGLAAALAVAVVGLAASLLYQLWNYVRLLGWLNRQSGNTAHGDATWGDVFYLLNKQLRFGHDRQQKAVAEMEQMLVATGALPDALVILDSDDRIKWLNEAAERQLGLSQKRDVGQFIYYLLRHAHFTEWLSLDSYNQPLLLKSPTAPEQTLSLRLVPMPRGQRMLFAHDVTELERVDAMRRDFVANVSHELRTPITVIAGFLETFDEMDAPDPEAFHKYVGLMLEQSNRIRRLLDDLLALARLEGEQDMKNETVDVPTLVEGLVNEARSLSQGQHRIELQMDTRAKLIGRSQELHSAFSNLVSNAVRYTPAGGSITLCWTLAKSGSAEFSVRDTGEGIALEHIPRLTERFYRVDRGRSRATGGTGLGLAIVKHVLQRHQGKLRVESVVGKGSTFTAVLPADRVIPDLAPAQPPAPEQAVA
ncbi:MAG TPA: phosphate regulon sensor histidine kinase PhoR [Parasulfuritortus sp.]